MPVTRILHVLGGLDRGGAETMVMNLYRNIDRSKIQFDFIIHTESHGDYTDEILKLGGKIFSFPKYKGSNTFYYIKCWKNFFRDHPEYRIIHSHIRSTASIYLPIAKKFGLKTIAHSHSTSSGKGISALVKNIFQLPLRYIADYLFSCSEESGIWLYGRRAIKKNNHKIIKNSIDAEKFIFSNEARKAIREEFNIKDEFVIGHIGRMTYPKNHEFLIEIFKKVHDKNPETKLMLVGAGELENRIKQKVIELGLSESVIFTGSRADVPELLFAMDVFVFPSRFEGLGIVVIEAQASGLYSVCSDAVPLEAKLSELVEYLSLQESAEKWADAVLSYQDGYKRKDMYQTICAAGYDIIDNVRWLEEFYLSNL